MTFTNKMRTPIEHDSEGYARVVDETVNGSKAVPVVFVVKDSDGYGYGSEGDPEAVIENDIHTPVEADAHGARGVVDEDVDGTKAIPLVRVIKNGEGRFEYHTLDIGGGSMKWNEIEGKPDTFKPSDHSHGIDEITDLQKKLNGKLSAEKAKAHPDSKAEDVETLVADFNALLGKLRSSGLLSE